MMKKLKKTYKILLFLSIGLLVFFLFWRASGSPGFTPEMAMEKLLHTHLIEDAQLILCTDGDNAVMNRRMKNMAALTDTHLYYCEMMGDPFLPWFEPGIWQRSEGLWSQPRGEKLTAMLGSTQYRGRPQVWSLPLYILPEDESLTWDRAEAALTIDDRGMGGKWDCAITYTADGIRSAETLTTLWFTEHDGYFTGTPPADRLASVTYEAWMTLYSCGKADMTLEITLYSGDRPVYTEQQILVER
ncbi:MAG: hypothetical protein IJF79_06100 [Clostridia bacterium]|nr:hypothetical protein [Clostridia bacterium]